MLQLTAFYEKGNYKAARTQLPRLLAQQGRTALMHLKNINSHSNFSLESREHFKTVFGQLLEATRVFRRCCNRVGGGVAWAVLPHHRTYGSVSGGSDEWVTGFSHG